MNESIMTFDTLRKITTGNKAICLHISNFCDLLKKSAGNPRGFNPITEYAVLKTGLYATLDDCTIYVSRIMAINYFRIAKVNCPVGSFEHINEVDKLNEEIEKNWSSEMLINTYGEDNANV